MRQFITLLAIFICTLTSIMCGAEEPTLFRTSVWVVESGYADYWSKDAYSRLMDDGTIKAGDVERAYRAAMDLLGKRAG